MEENIPWYNEFFVGIFFKGVILNSSLKKSIVPMGPFYNIGKNYLVVNTQKTVILLFTKKKKRGKILLLYNRNYFSAYRIIELPEGMPMIPVTKVTFMD